MDFVRQSSLRVANLLKADRWLSADHELGGEMVYEFGRITPEKRGGEVGLMRPQALQPLL